MRFNAQLDTFKFEESTLAIIKQINSCTKKPRLACAKRGFFLRFKPKLSEP